MPDTGAPYFIPFADPTDLVRDWPALSEDVAEAVADGLDAAGNAGIGSNVVQTVKTDTFSTASSTYQDVTGMSVTITPSIASSKVLVIVSASVGQSGVTSSSSVIRLSGGDSTTSLVGDAAGNRFSAAHALTDRNTSVWDTGRSQIEMTIVYLDSPNTTSPVTYTLQMAADGTAWLNRSGNDIDGGRGARTASTITAIEVAA